MISLEKTPGDGSPEERLRRLLSAAVESVEPGPGAQARLQSKIWGRRRDRSLPHTLRWVGLALLAVVILVGGGLALTVTGRTTESSSSSSSATAAGPAPAAASSSPSSGNANPTAGIANGGESAPSAAASKLPGPDSGSAPLLNNLDPLGRASTPSDLDGDHSPDRLMLSGQTLVVAFRSGTQSVTLPMTGAGERVLGVTQLQTVQGTWTPVAFVRIDAAGGEARDTIVAVVAGRLTVLRFLGQPVVLTVTASQGYTCAGSLVVSSGTSLGSDALHGYVVDGANLTPTGVTGATAKSGANCVFS